MSSSKITLVGLYSFLMYDNIDLFSELKLPDGIDKDTVVSNILQKSSEFEVQYPDTDYMIHSIKFWSSKWYWTFDKWIKAINIEYAPLENYDRTEGWKDITDKDTGNTRTFNNEDKTTLNNEDKTTLNNEDKRTLDTTNVAEKQVSAFDASTYQPSEKTTTDVDGTITDNHTGTITDNHTGTVTDNHTGTIKDDYNDDTTITHNGRIHGNIGVTTSQQMLESELNIAYFNMYDRIADIFISEYCIPVYI